MEYQLDTDICSAAMRGVPEVSRRVLKHAGQLYVSTIVLAELHAGCYRSQRRIGMRLQLLDNCPLMGQKELPKELEGEMVCRTSTLWYFSVMAVVWAALGLPRGGTVGAKDVTKTLAERLGYQRDARLLIVHADDIGMSHSVNRASIKALETGLVNSGSIMVPCPWFSEIAAWARSHPDADLGLHLTLTSEWEHYRWGPVASKEKVPSLLDPKGFLYPTETEAAARIDPREAEVEIRAQIERARAFGIQPTHLDSHMGTLFQNKSLFETLLRVGRQYRLPVLVARDWFSRADFLEPSLAPGDVVIDRMITIPPGVPSERWPAFYTEAIKSLSPGVTELIIHLAHDDEEMRAISINHPDWGAGWRQRDFDFFMSGGLRRLLEEQQVKLVTWREIGKRLGLAGPGQ